jgi:hypothetical protein
MQNSTAAVVPDAWHRCPLHWACALPGIVVVQKAWSPRGLQLSCMPTASHSQSRDWDDDMVLTVSALIRAFPQATLMRDCHGSTPLDLAIESKADYRVVALVHSATKQRLQQQQQKRVSRKAIKGTFKNHSDETSATDVESFPARVPGEISLIHVAKSSLECEPQRACSRTSKSLRRARTSPKTIARFEC